MKKQRKHYTPEEKVAILRLHLLEKVEAESAGALEEVKAGSCRVFKHYTRFIVTIRTRPGFGCSIKRCGILIRRLTCEILSESSYISSKLEQ